MRMQNIWCFFARPCSSCLTSHQIHFKLKINQRQNWTSRKHLIDQETISKCEWLIDSIKTKNILSVKKSVETNQRWVIDFIETNQGFQQSFLSPNRVHTCQVPRIHLPPSSLSCCSPLPHPPSLNTPSLGSNSACAQNLILRLYQLKPKFSIFNI